MGSPVRVLEVIHKINEISEICETLDRFSNQDMEQNPPSALSQPALALDLERAEELLHEYANFLKRMEVKTE